MKGWWDILLSLYDKFTADSVGERILTTGQHLAKLAAKNIVAPVFRTRCMSLTTLNDKYK